MAKVIDLVTVTVLGATDLISNADIDTIELLTVVLVGVAAMIPVYALLPTLTG